jgi:hypothetical protein
MFDAVTMGTAKAAGSTTVQNAELKFNYLYLSWHMPTVAAEVSAILLTAER